MAGHTGGSTPFHRLGRKEGRTTETGVAAALLALAGGTAVGCWVAGATRGQLWTCLVQGRMGL